MAKRSIITLIAIAIAAFLGAPAWANDNRVIAARHEGVVDATSIRWRSDYALAASAPEELELAFPLPAGTTLEPSADLAAVERGGRVIALRLLQEVSGPRHVSITLREPLPEGVHAVSFAPPLASGDAVQIIDVTGDDDLRFAPDSRTLLEPHVGFFASPDLAPSARDAADRAMGYVRARTIDDPMYVQTSPVLIADQGIRGALTNRGDRARAGVFGAAAIFTLLVLGLGLLYRRLNRAAELEDAEKTIAASYEDLTR